jgi:two-component system sensor histidine kinase AlgZ
MSRTPVRKPHGRRSDARPRVPGVAGGRSPARHAPASPDPADADTRPTSVWPASTRPAELNSQSFAPTHFDPLLDEKARDRARAGVALDVCNAMLALRVVLGVQAVLAIGALVAAGSMGDWLVRQSGAMYVGVAGTLLWLVTVCALKPALLRRPAAARLGSLLALGAASALIAWWPLWWLDLADAGQGLHLLGVALAGAALAGAAWAWLDLRARAWQPVDASVRLAELQSRIRPHFLFNALNTALALVRVDPARAEGVLEDLAQLFRVALADAGASVSLDEEIDLAQRYLAIEQIRYGHRLQVSWDIDARIGHARVPPLVLQPLVENAVRHGVEPSIQSARIWVQAELKRGQAVVLVSNTVPEAPSSPGHGMALRNVRERLRLLHDVAGQCDVWREGELFRARIIVPL